MENDFEEKFKESFYERKNFVRPKGGLYRMPRGQQNITDTCGWAEYYECEEELSCGKDDLIEYRDYLMKEEAQKVAINCAEQNMHLDQALLEFKIYWYNKELKFVTKELERDWWSYVDAKELEKYKALTLERLKEISSGESVNKSLEIHDEVIGNDSRKSIEVVQVVQEQLKFLTKPHVRNDKQVLSSKEADYAINCSIDFFTELKVPENIIQIEAMNIRKGDIQKAYYSILKGIKAHKDKDIPESLISFIQRLYKKMEDPGYDPENFREHFYKKSIAFGVVQIFN